MTVQAEYDEMSNSTRHMNLRKFTISRAEFRVKYLAKEYLVVL